VIKLLGGLTLELDGRLLGLPARRHAQLLLGYLALNPGLHARADVAALLWPEVLDSSARASLRSALASIRGSLGPRAPLYLVATRDRIGLADTQEVVVDVRFVEAHIRERRWEAALELSAGELLQGLDGDWVHQARHEHVARVDALLATLATAAEADDDLAKAILYTRAQVALDPLAEPPNRELMRRLTASGDRASALATYSRLSERFQRDLRALPSSETRAVADSIRGLGAGQQPLDDEPSPLPRALARPRQTPFVGRGGAIERLKGTLVRSVTDGRRLALVAGESGIGKTRLLSEFAQLANADGVSVLLGRCQIETTTPYEPFVEALRHYASVSPIERLRYELPPTAGELRPLIPEFDERLADLPAPLAGDPEGDRARVARAIVDTLLAAARHRSVVLVLDDLHLADPPTIRLLEYALVASSEARMMIVAAYRDVEATQTLRRMLGRARRASMTTMILLEGIDESAVRELARASGAGNRSPELAHAVYARTDGHPLFVEALLERELASEPTQREPRSATVRCAGSRLPERVTDFVEEELSRLTATARQVLAIASGVGDEFDYQLLVVVGVCSEQATLDALDESVAAGLTREVPGTVGRYEFRHPIVRESIFGSLTHTRRAHGHRRIAEALEQLQATTTEPLARRIAEQLLRAGGLAAPAKVADWAARAAQLAEQQHCHEDAAIFYERAVAALATSRANDVRRRGELLVALGHARRLSGGANAVRETFVEAATLARSVPDATLLAEAALGVCSVPFFPGNDPVDTLAVDLVEEALGLTSDGDAAMRARLTARLARELYFSGEPERTERLTEQALTLAHHADDTIALGEALDASYVVAGAGEAEQRIALAKEMIALGERFGSMDLLLRGYTRAATSSLELGDLQGFRHRRNQLEQLAESTHQPAYLWWVSLWRGTEALLAGRLDEGERLAELALHHGEPVFGEAAVVEYEAQVFWLRSQRGSSNELSLIAQALSARYTVAPVWRCAHAQIEARLGRLGPTQQLLDELVRTGPVMLRNDPAWLLAATLLAEAGEQLSRTTGTEILYEMLQPHASRWAVSASGSVCLCPISRPLALLAKTLGHTTDAALYSQDAITRARATGSGGQPPQLQHEREAAATVWQA